MSGKKRMVKSVVIGTLCGLLAGVIGMCLLAVFMLTAGLLSPDLTAYAMVAVASLGALAGAFIAVKLNKGAGLTVGAMTGLAMFLLLTITALAAGDSAFTPMTAIRLGAMLLGGALGGILALKERKRVI